MGLRLPSPGGGRCYADRLNAKSPRYAGLRNHWFGHWRDAQLRDCPRHVALRLAAVLISIFLPEAEAQADMGTPGLNRATLTHRISTHEPHPDHVFVVSRFDSVFFKADRDGLGDYRSVHRAEYVD